MTSAARSQPQKAYDGIRRLMFHNEIVPGQKIAYRELAERLGMSQTPVIQALKWLEFQGLVRNERHRGYFTEPISLQEVGEIYDLRELLEVDLLRRSLTRMTAADTRRIRAALEDHLTATAGRDLHARLAKDMHFHLALADCAGTRVHQQSLHNLFDLLYLKYGANVLFATDMRAAGAAHQELFEAILSADRRRAVHALRRHIRAVKKHVLAGVRRLVAARELNPL
ncbi:MAG: GntR family transcriptional regulator [Desulfosarcinaceae bacterium]|nr:GntR family transcriptional regulator [Desulfosarcinaceae bacterium]